MPGTTAAGLCAGCPSLIIPFTGDQPFWALRVRMLGLGPTPISRERLTAPRLARALRNLTTVKSYRIAAAELGERLRLENGVKNAADIIEREVDRWLTESPQPEPDPWAQLASRRPIPQHRRANTARGAARHTHTQRKH